MKNLIFTCFILQTLFFFGCDVDDTGNTGNTGNTGDSGNTGNNNNEGNFPNSHKGIDWSDLSTNKMTYANAIKYCKNIGGRLPTISELRTLAQNCPAIVTDGLCGVTDNCSSYDCQGSVCQGCTYDETQPGKYSVFSDTFPLLSSSKLSIDSNITWFLNFYNGQIDSNYESEYFDFFIRCIKDDSSNENDEFCQIEGETRVVSCSSDEVKNQNQICSSETWTNNGECFCPDENKFCNEFNGTFWSDLLPVDDSVEDGVDDGVWWYNAVEYCGNINGRLPTISELRTLVKNCPNSEFGGSCGVTDFCLDWQCKGNDCSCPYDETDPGKYSVFNDSEPLWSSSVEAGSNSGSHWVLVFGAASFNVYESTDNTKFRCLKN